MSLKSKLKSAASKAVSLAKKVVSKLGSAQTNRGQVISKAGSSVANTIKSIAGPAALGTLGESLLKPTSSGGQGFYSNPSNFSTPATNSGVKTNTYKSSGGATTIRSTADTSSGAFNSTIGLGADDISYYSAPQTYKGVDSIGSASLAGGTGLALPSAPSAPATAAIDDNARNAQLGASGMTGMFEPPVVDGEQANTPQSNWDSYLKQQEKDQARYEKDSANAMKQAREDSGIEAAQQRVQNTQNQINAITAQRDANILAQRQSLAQSGGTLAAFGGIQDQISYAATIKLLPLQAQLAADQGNLEQAEDNLNTLYNLYSKQVESRYNFRSKMLEKNWDFFNEQEKRQLAQQDKADQRKVDYFNDRNKYLESLTTTALKYGMETGKMSAFNRLSKMQLPTNYSDPDWENQMQNILNDASEVVATRMAGGTGGGGTVSTTVKNYADLLSQGKITLANVPQSIRNDVVAYAGSNISKPLSDTAVKEIQQSESAVANLQALRATVENNLQFVGPVSGLARLNPYSEARKVQAEIDRVRQQVGKTLEGGVLRKEDEEKYKKILATLSDTPETALYKIDALISSINRDVEAYKSIQQDTGRYIPGGTASEVEDLRAKYNY